MTMMSGTSKIFISYSRKDGEAYAQKLFAYLRENGLKAWYDKLIVSGGWEEQIEQELEASSHVLVCITPEVHLTQSFVRREILLAQRLEKVIIPLVFSRVDHIPLTIIHLQYVDFSDWEKGCSQLYGLLKFAAANQQSPQTLRELELHYLAQIAQQYEANLYDYTELMSVTKNEILSAQEKVQMLLHHQVSDEPGYIPDWNRSRPHTVETFDSFFEAIVKYTRVALIGDPGGGKTTTMQRLAYGYAVLAAEEPGNPLPLLVNVGAYNGGGFSVFLDSFFGGLGLEHYLGNGRIVLLLDGLNEMPLVHLDEVDQWITDHPNINLIVSCRKLDYEDRKLQLRQITIMPLDVLRIKKFIHQHVSSPIEGEKLFWALAGQQAQTAWNWFRGYSDLPEPDLFEGFWGLNKKGKIAHHLTHETEKAYVKNIQEALESHGLLPEMLSLATNPFMLSLIVQIYNRRAQLPQNKGQLFDEFVNMLLQKASSDNPSSRIEMTSIKQALATLAYGMCIENTGTTITMRQAVEFINRQTINKSAEEILSFAAQANLLSVGETVRFAHQLLQEFFATWWMREEIKKGVDPASYWPRVYEIKPGIWSDIALMLAEVEEDVTSLVNWLTPVHPTLAYQCAKLGAKCQSETLQLLYDPPPPLPYDPIARAEWGRMLAEQGDSRSGVGLTEAALPDISWIRIPAGNCIFQQGEEKTLPEYSISRYPVTNAQFQAFVAAENGYSNVDWWETPYPLYEPSEMFLDNHPCVCINFYQAKAFCRWLTDQYIRYGLLSVGGIIRLATEVEWEKAARGQTGWLYPWGNSYFPARANVNEIVSDAGPYYLGKLTAVGLYRDGVSPYGVSDMSGNVWELCSDERDSDRPVLKGGSFHFRAEAATCISRSYIRPDQYDYDYGFRVVMQK